MLLESLPLAVRNNGNFYMANEQPGETQWLAVATQLLYVPLYVNTKPTRVEHNIKQG